MDYPAAKLHARRIARHIGGETIEYRRHPSMTFEAIPARVRRDPEDELGGISRGVIHVVISLDDLDGDPAVDQDQIMLAQRAPGETRPVYRVRRALFDGLGSVTVEAVR